MSGTLIFFDDQLKEALHVRQFVAVRVLQADVDDVRPAFDLGAGDFRRLLVFPFADQPLELPRADARSSVRRPRRPVGVLDLDGLDAGDGRRMRAAAAARLVPGKISAMARIWSGVVPQQPPTILSQPCSAKPASFLASELRRFVVLAVLVGQAGVRIAADKKVREIRTSVRI